MSPLSSCCAIWVQFTVPEMEINGGRLIACMEVKPREASLESQEQNETEMK
jgi:hypothetical protein